MTKSEKTSCIRLADEAYRNATRANDLFYDSEHLEDNVGRRIAREQALNTRGYAEGIHQALVTIGFKHELMTMTEKALGIYYDELTVKTR